MLTEKQNKFCVGIVKGLSGKDAYKSAYNTQANDNTINKEVVKLLDKEEIQQRISELRKPLEVKALAETITDRERIKNMLWSFVDNPTLTPETRMKASDQINKMNAEYINVNRNIDDTASTLSGLDTESLKQLLQ